MGLQLAKEEVENGVSTSETVKLLDDIRSSSETAVGILNEFLTFDKLESGTLVLEKTNVIIWEFVYELVRTAEVQVRTFL